MVARPVNYVCFWDACRFANWLQNGRPGGAQGSETTETGTYTLTGDAIANNTVVRNAGSLWAIANEDEWYKAAYHDKNAGIAATYFVYPTSTDASPGSDMTDASGNNANIYTGGAYPLDSGKYTTLAGEFQNSESPYGTYDQGGNVWEWNESIVDGSSRALRGGSYFSTGTNFTRAAIRAVFPTDVREGCGFRIASVPEPGSLAMLAGIAVTALLYCLRKRTY